MPRYDNLIHVIPKILPFFLAYLEIFLYLRTVEEYINHTMNQSNQCLGRTELAARYFPFIQPQSAWQKLRSLLLDNPALAHLARLNRRTFLPAEVNQIYDALGHP